MASTSPAQDEFPDLDSLIDRELILKWLYWGLFWLVFTPSLGVTISSLFNYPDYLGTSLYLTFGRLRPMHVNGVIFGAFSTLFIALCYYLLPRLCGVPIWKGQWGHWLVWVWNLGLIAGMASLMLGYNQGLEAGEFPLLIDIVIFIVVTLLTVQFLVTIARRRERQLFVAVWYLIGAFVWTVINLILGSFILPYYITGINSAAFHGLFLHYIVGLWITPAGYVLIYYFLPASVKNPVYSHKLSLVGFWSLALFYPFVGIHHYLYSPIADWAETLAIITSMLLIVPVWTVLQNFFGTMIGRWHTFGQNLPAKFLIMGSLMYLAGCFQGSTEALRLIQQPTHFSDFVISHSHLTVFGTFVVWAIGGTVYVLPKLVGRPLWSFTMGNWSFWLITFGISLMGLDLTLAGLQQGYILMAGAEWLDSLVAIRPYWLVRTVAGISMDTGMSLLVYNLMRTVLSAPSPAPRARPAPGGAVLSGSRAVNRYGLRFYALVAGFGCITLAAFVQGVLPMLEPQSRTDKVTKVVRTDLGELKWMEHQAGDYTPLELRGRQVYTREGCWYCHSQYVRPVTGETRRWGPVTQAGEYAYDLPHMFSTRRIGPDLSRVGLKYSDAWHLAHFWNPRMLSPDSIMPRFTGLFDGPYRAKIVADANGNRTLEKTPATEKLFDFKSDQQIQLTPNAEGLLFVPERGKYPVIFTPNKEYSGEVVTLVAETEDLKGLVAYLQKLGTNRGKWRDRFEPQLMEASQVTVPRSEEWIDYGKQVYERRCLGCHGEKGDGNGPAAAFMQKDRPRNFTLGVFKFRLTPSGSMPDDGDLLRTITRGVRGTAMPSWHELLEKDRLAVIQYIKYELSADRSKPDKPYLYFVEEPPNAPIYIAEPPKPSQNLVRRGQAVWKEAKCWECHGDSGKGDGEKAADLKDDFDFPIPPANLTTGQFKSGPSVKDIFRTMSTGLSGTPMPSFSDSLSEEDRWALSYYVLSLSAFKDPLTGEPMQVSEKDRSALNDPGLRASESHYAYKSSREEKPRFFGGEAWAKKHGFDFTTARDPTSNVRQDPR